MSVYLLAALRKFEADLCFTLATCVVFSFWKLQFSTALKKKGGRESRGSAGMSVHLVLAQDFS